MIWAISAGLVGSSHYDSASRTLNIRAFSSAIFILLSLKASLFQGALPALFTFGVWIDLFVYYIEPAGQRSLLAFYSYPFFFGPGFMLLLKFLWYFLPGYILGVKFYLTLFDIVGHRHFSQGVPD